MIFHIEQLESRTLLHGTADPAGNATAIAAAASATAAGWTAAAPLPLARTEAQQAVKNGLLYVFGGFYNAAWQATRRVDVYNPSADAWTRLPDMPVAVTHAARVIDGNNVILVGGFVGSNPGQATRDVWMFNVRNRKWASLPPLPAPRGGGGAGILGTNLYFFGGVTRDQNGDYQTDYGNTWRLDLANLSAGWNRRAAMPNPRNHLAYATLGDRVYAIGGQVLDRESTGNLSDVHAYDPATNAWSAVASLPRPLGHAHSGTIVHDGRIVVFGGTSTGAVNRSEILTYERSTDTWTQAGELPVARKSANAMIHDGRVYLAGGGDDEATTAVFAAAWAPAWQSAASMPVSLGEVAAGVIGDKMYVVGETSAVTAVYDLSRDAWSTSTAPQRPFVGHHHAAEVLGGKWYVIGGLGGGSPGKLQIYDPASSAWTSGPDMPYDGGSVSSAVIGGKIYVAGGIVGATPSQPAGAGTTRRAAVFDPAVNRWSFVRSMPKGVNHAASATDGRKLYVFGGRGGTNVVGNGVGIVQVYDPARNKWTSSRERTIAAMPIGRGGTGKAVYDGGKFYVTGGETTDGPGATDNGVYKRVDVFDIRTNSWSQGPAMPTARHGVFPVLHAGRIYVAAGGVRSGFSSSAITEVLQLT